MKKSVLHQRWRQENLAEGMFLEVITKINGYSIKQLQSLQS
jgi:hypothetical protein